MIAPRNGRLAVLGAVATLGFAASVRAASTQRCDPQRYNAHYFYVLSVRNMTCAAAVTTVGRGAEFHGWKLVVPGWSCANLSQNRTTGRTIARCSRRSRSFRVVGGDE